MTEEEKNTNETAEAQEKDDEEKDKDKKKDNPDLKVVMPEPNRVTMPAEKYEDEPDYLKVFCNFYIAEFNQKDLEIMNTFDKDYNVVEINHYLQNNINFPRKLLIKHVLHRHAKHFQALLDEIAKETGLDYKNVKTYQQWEDWYEDRRKQIPGSLS